MIIISTREQKAQNVILNALFNITNLTIRIDGELIISLNEEDETIKIFLSLLHQNLVGSVMKKNQSLRTKICQKWKNHV